MKEKKTALIIICIMFFIWAIGKTVIYNCTYHVNINYTDVQEVECSQIMGNFQTKQYTSEKEIKSVLKSIGRLHFFTAKPGDRLQESPGYSVYIMLKDGTSKSIDFSGGLANITDTHESRQEDIDNGKADWTSEIYYVNLIDVERFFNGLWLYN